MDTESDFSNITPEWRNKMLKAAQDPETLFTAIRPERSGLRRTIHASEQRHYPVVIVDGRPGYHLAPDDQATVLAIGERSGDPSLDWWLQANAGALWAYCVGDMDTIDFYDAMRTSPGPPPRSDQSLN